MYMYDLYMYLHYEYLCNNMQSFQTLDSLYATLTDKHKNNTYNKMNFTSTYNIKS